MIGAEKTMIFQAVSRQKPIVICSFNPVSAGDHIRITHGRFIIGRNNNILFDHGSRSYIVIHFSFTFLGGQCEHIFLQVFAIKQGAFEKLHTRFVIRQGNDQDDLIGIFQVILFTDFNGWIIRYQRPIGFIFL